MRPTAGEATKVSLMMRWRIDGSLMAATRTQKRLDPPVAKPTTASRLKNSVSHKPVTQSPSDNTLRKVLTITFTTQHIIKPTTVNMLTSVSSRILVSTH
jgi:hypothetical protein